MTTYFRWTASALLIGGLFGSCKAWAQIGTPTAPPPGGANAAGTSGAAGTAQPAGAAGTTSPTGRAAPAGRAGTSTPATRFGAGGSRLLNDPSVAPRGFDPSTGRTYFGDGTSAQQVFGGNPGMFNRGPATGAAAGANVGATANTGRAPGSALRGRANFSPGSTSATLLPGGPILGVPNLPANGVVTFGPAPLDQSVAGNVPLTNWDAVNLGVALGAVVAPIAPVAPLAPQTDIAPTAPVAPVAPTAPAAQVILNAGENDASGRTGIEPRTAVTVIPREPAVEQRGTATATAFPSRNPTATGDATVTGSPATATTSAAPDFTEVPTTSGTPPITSYRGNIGATGQRSGLTYSYPGYTLWQGYYWYNSPAAGWHYWDGLRWVQFDRTQNNQ